MMIRLFSRIAFARILEVSVVTEPLLSTHNTHKAIILAKENILEHLEALSADSDGVLIASHADAAQDLLSWVLSQEGALAHAENKVVASGLDITAAATPLGTLARSPSFRSLLNLPSSFQAPPLPGEGGTEGSALCTPLQSSATVEERREGVLCSQTLHLFDACSRGDSSSVLSLLSSSSLGARAHHPQHGATAMHLLAGALQEQAHAGDIGQAIRALVHAGADVNAPSANGATPLHWAAGAGNAHAVAALLAGGADGYARTYTWRRQVFGRGSGQTALHWAAESDRASLLPVLASFHPLLVCAQDERGRTAGDVARVEGSREAALVLEGMEAQPWVLLRVRTQARMAAAVPSLDPHA